MNSFYVEISTGPVLLTRDQIWPDGDGPANPTKLDVENFIRTLCPYPWDLFELAQKWNLHDQASLDVMNGVRDVSDKR